MTTEERSTAYHEAAHAVAAHHLIGTESVGALSVVRDGNSLGRHAPVPLPISPSALGAVLSKMPSEELVDLSRGFLVMLYAGFAADIRIDPGNVWAVEAFEEITPAAEAVAETIDPRSHDLNDRDWVEVMLADLVLSRRITQAERGRLREESRASAHRFVAEHWTEIATLGEELLARKTMTGPQVRRALRPAPPPSRRARKRTP